MFVCSSYVAKVVVVAAATDDVVGGNALATDFFAFAIFFVPFSMRPFSRLRRLIFGFEQFFPPFLRFVLKNPFLVAFPWPGAVIVSD